VNALAEPRAAPPLPVRVEVIDAYDQRWPQALELIDRLGHRRRLGIEDDWLPARRNLLVAFVGGQPAGHLSFCVEPVVELSPPPRRVRIEAHVDGCGVDDGYDKAAIFDQLHAAAHQRARQLGIARLHASRCRD